MSLSHRLYLNILHKTAMIIQFYVLNTMYIYLVPSTWYCNTRLMESSGVRYTSSRGKPLRFISLAYSPGTTLYTIRSNTVSRLKHRPSHVNIEIQLYQMTMSTTILKLSYLRLNSGLVLCSCTSHIGQNLLPSKYLRMHDRQTGQKQT